MRVLSYVIIATIFTICGSAFGQDAKLENKVNVLFGVNQLLIDGFNAEVNVFYKRLAFDYSHGVSLNFPNNFLVEADREQGLAMHVPWTTGFGLGYRFNNWLNLRVEPKWHKYELFFDEQEQIAANLLGDYTIFTLGLGLYGNLQPFKKQDNLLKGIMLAPSVRWWPRVSTSLDNNELSYVNKQDEAIVHKVPQIGFGGSAFFANVSIGYSINF